ncbi:hypothetical protein AURDEDRAFT_163312 [Auricularia subglabra TFB-10046 SS5]|nr:hypothetical protein AURDEDRAFT_163312 [Auricularia subglabra TFB-10046 SS5]
MLDPVREAELERYLRQFCDDAFRGTQRVKASGVLDATLVLHSVLAGAAERWNAALLVNAVPPRLFSFVLDYLPYSERIQVARVCRHWRRAATSEPRLWSRLIFKLKYHYSDPNDPEVVRWANPGFFRQSLGWSTGHILDLTVYGVFGIYVDAFCDAYPGVAARLRSLYVDFVVSYKDVERISDVLSVPSPFLEHLTISHGSGSAGPDGITLRPPFAVPRLCSLSVRGCSLSDAMDPLHSVTKLTVAQGPVTDAPRSWTTRIFALFPNLDELHIPNYGEPSDFPLAPGPSYRLQALSIGSERPDTKLLHLPPYPLSAIPRVTLLWPSHKVAKDLLEEFASMSPRTLSITAAPHGWGFRLALTDADQDFQRECALDERELYRLLAAITLPAVTTVTLSDQCFPDPIWRLVSSLPAATQLTFLISGSGCRRMLTHVDSPSVKSSPPHPSLQTVIIRDDQDYYTSKSGSPVEAQRLPSVFAADAPHPGLLLEEWSMVIKDEQKSSLKIPRGA